MNSNMNIGNTNARNSSQDNSLDKKSAINIITKTWSRDSHGLYDYESTQTKSAQIQAAENSFIYRKKQEIKIQNQFEENKDEEHLLDVKLEKNGKFHLRNVVPVQIQPTEKNINDLQNKIWYIIKHDETSGANANNTQQFVNTNEDYHICLNDIIKLGRVKYAANEIHIHKLSEGTDVVDSDSKNSPYNVSAINLGTQPVFDFIYKSSTPPANILDEITCKICLMGSSDDQNPLVDLCKCTGGIKYTHYTCLKLWMQTKLSKKENEKKTVTSYNIKSFNCEICKTPFPFRLTVNGNNDRIYDLIDIVRPEKQNYIILESLNQLKDNNNIKSIHVISLDDQKVTLGRGHESDVRINDISVSRTHASIIFNPISGKICIRDLKSKFGTLVLIKNEMEVKDKKIHLQIGRSYFEVSTLSLKDCDKIKSNKEKVENQTNKPVNSNSNMQLNISSPDNHNQLTLSLGLIRNEDNYTKNISDEFDMQVENRLHINQNINLEQINKLGLKDKNMKK